MSAALRTVQATPSMRPLGAAFGGIVIAGAILAALVAGQLAGAGSAARPAAVSNPAAFDRGWASESIDGLSAPVLNDRGWASASEPGPAGGGSNGAGGSHGTRLAK